MPCRLVFGFLVAVLWACTSLPASAAGEARRIALVVGNGAYASSPLANPANDADLIAATLRDLGFEVKLQKNGDQKSMKRAISDFGAALETAGANTVGLFYYAGHGVQINGRNYLIPVGASIERDADVDIEAVSADWVLEQMRYARNRLNFVILDACRNNPFVRSSRSAGQGLAKMDAPAGVLIAYSTAPGDVAADGDGRNSPYSTALAQRMRASGEPAELMFKETRDTVRQMTAERQTPWESSSLTGQNFYFAKTATQARASAPVAARAPAPAAPQVPPDDDAPLFMSQPLCAHAVGTWNIESASMKARVTLDGRAGGRARIGNVAGPVDTTWDCDGDNRRITIRFAGHGTQTVVMDQTEKMAFGYDEKEVPVIYTR